MAQSRKDKTKVTIAMPPNTIKISSSDVDIGQINLDTTGTQAKTGCAGGASNSASSWPLPSWSPCCPLRRDHGSSAKSSSRSANDGLSGLLAQYSQVESPHFSSSQMSQSAQ